VVFHPEAQPQPLVALELFVIRDRIGLALAGLSRCRIPAALAGEDAGG
jgi:hypothetical protein